MPAKFRQAGIVDVAFGDNVTVVNPVNLYGCSVGDDSFIGPFVEIQSQAAIGRRCRIQSHSFICSGVTLGDDCFVAHGVMFVNDLFKDGRPDYKGDNWKGATIGSSVLIGSNATILPVSICDGAVIGAGSVVAKDIVKPGIYLGNPAKFVRAISQEVGARK